MKNGCVNAFVFGNSQLERNENSLLSTVFKFNELPDIKKTQKKNQNTFNSFTNFIKSSVTIFGPEDSNSIPEIARFGNVAINPKRELESLEKQERELLEKIQTQKSKISVPDARASPTEEVGVRNKILEYFSRPFSKFNFLDSIPFTSYLYNTISPILAGNNLEPNDNHLVETKKIEKDIKPEIKSEKLGNNVDDEDVVKVLTALYKSALKGSVPSARLLKKLLAIDEDLYKLEEKLPQTSVEKTKSQNSENDSSLASEILQKFINTLANASENSKNEETGEVFVDNLENSDGNENIKNFGPDLQLEWLKNQVNKMTTVGDPDYVQEFSPGPIFINQKRILAESENFSSEDSKEMKQEQKRENNLYSYFASQSPTGPASQEKVPEIVVVLGSLIRAAKTGSKPAQDLLAKLAFLDKLVSSNADLHLTDFVEKLSESSGWVQQEPVAPLLMSLKQSAEKGDLLASLLLKKFFDALVSTPENANNDGKIFATYFKSPVREEFQLAPTSKFLKFVKTLVGHGNQPAATFLQSLSKMLVDNKSQHLASFKDIFINTFSAAQHSPLVNSQTENFVNYVSKATSQGNPTSASLLAEILAAASRTDLPIFKLEKGTPLSLLKDASKVSGREIKTGLNSAIARNIQKIKSDLSKYFVISNDELSFDQERPIFITQDQNQHLNHEKSKQDGEDQFDFRKYFVSEGYGEHPDKKSPIFTKQKVDPHFELPSFLKKSTKPSKLDFSQYLTSVENDVKTPEFASLRDFFVKQKVGNYEPVAPLVQQLRNFSETGNSAASFLLNSFLKALVSDSDPPAQLADQVFVQYFESAKNLKKKPSDPAVDFIQFAGNLGKKGNKNAASLLSSLKDIVVDGTLTEIASFKNMFVDIFDNAKILNDGPATGFLNYLDRAASKGNNAARSLLKETDISSQPLFSKTSKSELQRQENGFLNRLIEISRKYLVLDESQEESARSDKDRTLEKRRAWPIFSRITRNIASILANGEDYKQAESVPIDIQFAADKEKQENPENFNANTKTLFKNFVMEIQNQFDQINFDYKIKPDNDQQESKWFHNRDKCENKLKNGEFETGDLRNWVTAIEPESEGTIKVHSYFQSNDIKIGLFKNHGPGSYVLFQDIKVAKDDILMFKYRIENQSKDGFKINSKQMSQHIIPSQQIRIDIVEPWFEDWFTAKGDTGVLGHVLKPEEAQNESNQGWRLAKLNLTRFEGKTVRLAFRLVNNQDVMTVGITQVKVKNSEC
ncbi:hypothetical protein HK100_001689 [Physocladia obscura]|uniref:Uncharacterized protein n=1 Tax=Physocladia obscura TaxID=109957 RepID=A0AAD5SZH0_9FUNG|nr:hypothetical protein HK100_001689 [Physocladia obscura]